jgi:uncharacterized protein (DUF302 family)
VKYSFIMAAVLVGLQSVGAVLRFELGSNETIANPSCLHRRYEHQGVIATTIRIDDGVMLRYHSALFLFIVECVPMCWRRALSAVYLTVGLLSGSLASATEPPANVAIATVSKPDARYQDVRDDLLMAIEAQGFVVGAIGDLGGMLTRSASDFGHKPVYLAAEYFNFCPTAIAHELVAADPTNLAYCPFQLFLYEAVATPGTIVVGYRHPGIDGTPATRAILAKAEQVFAGIIRAAVK